MAVRTEAARPQQRLAGPRVRPAKGRARTLVSACELRTMESASNRASSFFMGSILLDPPENPSLIPANCYNPLTGQRVGQLFVTLGTLSDSPMGNCVEK